MHVLNMDSTTPTPQDRHPSTYAEFREAPAHAVDAHEALNKLSEIFTRFAAAHYAEYLAKYCSARTHPRTSSKTLRDSFAMISCLDEVLDWEDLPLSLKWVGDLDWTSEMSFFSTFISTLLQIKGRVIVEDHTIDGHFDEGYAKAYDDYCLFQARALDLMQKYHSGYKIRRQRTALAAWVFVLIVLYQVREGDLDVQAAFCKPCPSPKDEPQSLIDTILDDRFSQSGFVLTPCKLEYEEEGPRSNFSGNLEDHPLNGTPKSYKAKAKLCTERQLLPAFGEVHEPFNYHLVLPEQAVPNTPAENEGEHEIEDEALDGLEMTHLSVVSEDSTPRAA